MHSQPPTSPNTAPATKSASSRLQRKLRELLPPIERRFLEGRPYTENAYTALTYTKTGFHGHQASRFHVHTGVFTIFTYFHVHSWFFHVHLHTFSRTYFGFHVHLLFSRPRPVFTYTPSFSSSFGQTDFGHIFRVQMAPQVRRQSDDNPTMIRA